MKSKFDQNLVTTSDLKALLIEQPEMILIDLLSPEHFAGRHIPGAQNACVFQVSFLDDLAVAAPDKKVSIVVYGASIRCQDAAMALEKMDRAGYEHVSFLKGDSKHGERPDTILKVMQPTSRMIRKRR